MSWLRKKKDELLPGNAKRRTANMRVREVSIVDRPANQEPFYMVKRDDGMGDTDLGAEILVSGGRFYTALIKSEDAEITVEKIAAGVKEGATTILTDVIAQLAAIVESMAASEDTETGSLPPEIGVAIAAAGDMLWRVLSRYPYPHPIAKSAGAKPMTDTDIAEGLEALKKAVALLKQEGGKISAKAKEGTLKILAEATERLASITNAVKAAPEGDDGDGMPAALARSIEAVATTLKSISSTYPGPEGQGETDMDKVKETLAKLQKELGDRSALAGAVQQISSDIDALSKAQDVDGALSEEDRKEKFKEVMTKLADLGKQLGEADSLTEKSIPSDPSGAQGGPGHQPNKSVTGDISDVVEKGTNAQFDRDFKEMLKRQDEMLELVKSTDAKLEKEIGERKHQISELAKAASGLQKEAELQKAAISPTGQLGADDGPSGSMAWLEKSSEYDWPELNSPAAQALAKEEF